jgi:hypothetical protein
MGRASGKIDWIRWREELCKRVKSKQIRLLKDFGVLFAMAQERQDYIESCRPAAVQNSGTIPKKAASQLGAIPETPTTRNGQPMCACGAGLLRITSKTRVGRMLGDAVRSPMYIPCMGRPAQDAVRNWKTRLLRSHSSDEALWAGLACSVKCALCDKVATRSGFSWSCPKSNSTLWHHTGHDICESCVHYYVISTREAEDNFDDTDAIEADDNFERQLSTLSIQSTGTDQFKIAVPLSPVGKSLMPWDAIEADDNFERQLSTLSTQSTGTDQFKIAGDLSPGGKSLMPWRLPTEP